VAATQALNLSAGVSKSNVFLGRWLSCRATLFSCACECRDKSVPFGKYCLSSLFVFSFEPRCQGLLGSHGFGTIAALGKIYGVSLDRFVEQGTRIPTLEERYARVPDGFGPKTAGSPRSVNEAAAHSLYGKWGFFVVSVRALRYVRN